jgi:hypothetical protein
MIGRVVFELPVPIVLAALWLAGAVLMGTSALALYYLWSLVVEAV